LTTINKAFPAEKPYVSVWLPFWSFDRGYGSLLKNLSLIDEVNFFIYSINDNSDLICNTSKENIETVQNITNINNIKLIPTISGRGNYFNQCNQENIIKSIKDVVATYNFPGIDINFETDYGSTPPVEIDKEKFKIFIKKLKKELGADKQINITLGSGELKLNKNFFNELEQYVNLFKFMAYDYYGLWGEFGASGDFMEEAKKLISAQKLLLGIPAYGRDWGKRYDDTEGSIIYSQIEELFCSKNNIDSKWEWDEESKASHFSYITFEGKQTQVWYEGPKGLYYKLNDIVKPEGLKGIAIWAIGQENPKIWDVIKNSSAEPAILDEQPLCLNLKPDRILLGLNNL